ncbi:hypothetical protein COV15_00150 [Candidatus Woesearchaeota archaeon CG10_big_fil_rev_8_21_14_0_10_34_12]|nr:MAG: hypothetical protein COV15_00150 [Candidatus Woesearchaeota archaeon CG10_big_fil_rev_8_21_14_0_10_34_12]
MRWKMDKKRVLSKIDELDSYLAELDTIKPVNFEEYGNSVEKKRACERLLQISIEAVVDMCNMIISGLKLGLPANEEEILNKLENKRVISKEMKKILTKMKGFRNILVHKYGAVDDELVFEMLPEKSEDFEKFREEILRFLEKF